MRIGDFVYFAPDIPFCALDVDGSDLPGQFKQRMHGYYMDPAIALCKAGPDMAGYAFGAGLLLVSAIDALARLQYGDEPYTKTDRNGRTSTDSGQRFRDWVRDELDSFKEPVIARRFYTKFRCGLVHEARVKDANQFSLEQDQAVIDRPIMSVNPVLLASEVEGALSRFILSLERDVNKRLRFAHQIKREFRKELAGCGPEKTQPRSSHIHQAS